jgi:hypothetical protein
MSVGRRVDKGTQLVQIADLSPVWSLADAVDREEAMQAWRTVAYEGATCY